MADSLIGKDCQITVDGARILGIGTWSMSGMSVATLEDTEFLDDHAKFEVGLINSGTIEFSGQHKLADTTGQTVVAAALQAGTKITDIKLYANGNSYYTPNSTTAAGGGLPAETMVSWVHIINSSISADKNGLVTVSYTAQISGAMRLI